MLSGLSVVPNIDDWTWDPLTGDRDESGDFSVGDIVSHEGKELFYGKTGFASIQDAIFAAQPGDEILIEPGVYIESLGIDKNLTLRGASGIAADVLVSPPDPIYGTALTIAAFDHGTNDRGANDVTIENMRFAGGQNSIVYSSSYSPAILALNNVEIANSSYGIQVSGGNVAITDSLIDSNGYGVDILGGLVTIAESELTNNSGAGVQISPDGAAIIGDNSSIRFGTYGIVCDGGRLFLENTNMNNNKYGLLVNASEPGTNPLVDAGQVPGSTNDFTGLGVSTGGNDFSGYEPVLYPYEVAILVYATDPVPDLMVGPTGLPPAGNDIAAFGNSWLSSDPREIEGVIWHDPDPEYSTPHNVMRFVDYAVLSNLVVTADDVDEATPVVLDVAFANDPQSHTVLIEWGDGASDSLSLGQNEWDPTANHLYAASGQYTIQVTVVDQLGDTLTQTTTVTVGGGSPVNEPPVVSVDNALVTVDEGTVASNSGSFADPDLGDDVAIVASIGTVTKTGTAAGEWTWSWDATDGPLATVVTITADDGQGGVATTTFDLVVNNVAPTLVAANMAVEENSPNGTLVGAVQATDPGDDVLTFSIVGGDGAMAFAVDPATGAITVADSTELDHEYVASYELIVQVTDDDGAFDTAAITVEVINRPSITGAVFVDVNQNGVYDANEPAVDGVLIELLDEFGVPVLDDVGDPITAVTEGGFYLFEDLPAGTYQILQNQPTGLNDGPEILGTLGGAIVANDVMQVTLTTVDAHDYFFAEIGQQVTDGDTASVSFWNSQNGRNLLIAAGTDLTDWLTTNFSNVFGNLFVGADGNMVHQFFQHQLFRQRGILSRIVNHVDTQFMALALADYFTTSDLGGDLGAAYGFNATQTGISTKVVNVGICGAAFGVANGTNMTIWQLLQATNSMTDVADNLSGYAHIYDANGNGQLSLSELLLRTQAQLVFSLILLRG